MAWGLQLPPAMNDPKQKKPKRPITSPPPRRPGRKERATPGFGEDGTGERLTRKVQREVENPIVKSES